MARSFADQWNSATAVLGWAILGKRDDSEHDPLLVQLRGTQRRRGPLQRESIILMRSESGHLAEVISMDNMNKMVDVEILRSDLQEIDAATSGTRVSVVLDQGQLLQWHMNNAHASIILDRIAAGELDPHDDVLRALRGPSSTREQLSRIDLDDARRRAGPGRVPTEAERVARLTTLLERERIRQQMMEAEQAGDEERANALAEEFLRHLSDSVRRHEQEFGPDET
jgi:hypothetical protein